MGFKIPDAPLTEVEDGVWADYEGSQFKIAYATNGRFMRIKQRLEQPHRRKIEGGSFDPVEHKKILAKAMAEGILLDWRSVTGPEGGDQPFSVKLAEQALLFDEAFREFVMEFSVNLQNFKDLERESEGNS